jgi:hypothetical protein
VVFNSTIVPRGDARLGPQTGCGSSEVLCWSLGHRCDHGSGAAAPLCEARESAAALLAYRAYLLECWLSANPHASGPRWRVRVTTGQAGRLPEGGPWTTDDIRGSDLYPLSFPDDANGISRHAVTVSRLAPGQLAGLDVWQRHEVLEAARDGVVAAVADRVVSTGRSVDARARLLLADLVWEFGRWNEFDIAQVGASAVAGGEVDPDTVHFVRYERDGRLVAVTVTPSVDQAPWMEPACLMSGHRCPEPAPDDAATRADRVALVRGECASRLLSTLYLITNSSAVQFNLSTDQHGLKLPMTNPQAADSEFRSWWDQAASPLTRTGFDDAPAADPDGPPLTCWPLRRRIDVAAAAELNNPADVGDNGDLGAYLFQELVGDAVQLVAAAPGDQPLAYISGIHYAVDVDDDEDEEVYGVDDEDAGFAFDDGWEQDGEGVDLLVLVGRHRVATVEVAAFA